MENAEVLAEITALKSENKSLKSQLLQAEARLALLTKKKRSTPNLKSIMSGLNCLLSSTKLKLLLMLLRMKRQKKRPFQSTLAKSVSQDLKR